jgi:hypothetical protein
MKGAPYRPLPEGRFSRSIRSAARLIETFGTGVLPRSFGLAEVLLLLCRRLFTWNRISVYGAYLSAFGALLFLYLMYDAFCKKPLAGDIP